GVSTVAISPDGKTLVSGSYDDTIKIWQVTGEPREEPQCKQKEEGTKNTSTNSTTYSDSYGSYSAYSPGSRVIW
ncbi:WD40 repeat domain-containing protein, partial [Fischerella thermalis]